MAIAAVPEPLPHQTAFVEFALDAGVLRFGDFVTKSGRRSPYFFNTGAVCNGAGLGKLADAYAASLLASEIAFDMLFGPAYKGITLAASTAMQLSLRGRDTSFAYNRKEAKDHGEGGLLVGAPLQGRVVIVDDVITDGAAKRESIELLRTHSAEPAAVLIALDRAERVTDDLSSPSAVQRFAQDFGVPVVSIINSHTIVQVLDQANDVRAQVIRAHLAQYGAN
jgi:orotate phosphoribosyltransferase